MLEQQLLAESDRRLRAETAERLADADGSTSLEQAPNRERAACCSASRSMFRANFADQNPARVLGEVA